ncbi:MAG: DUF3102 domain-containing protein [Desulfobacterales bacterium]|nr:DUF3102 domain-containing protein [Desulfobacterales bacterium]
MQLTSAKDRTEEIRRELVELNQTLKMSVQKAIKIGQLLTEQKEFVGHGGFLSWIDERLDISKNTVERYMKLYSYQNKIPNLGNLQDAYKQIETLEQQEKLSKQERERSMVSEYRKTGTKPAGWDRSLDYRVKKDAEAEVRQKERIEKANAEREQRAKEYKERQETVVGNATKTGSTFADAFQVAAENFVAKTEERKTWKEKIRLSDGGKEDAFMDAIIDYMETLPNDNRRIEACSNIIKICRNISIELQQAT